MTLLPAGLEAWADPLRLLEPELAAGLTPLVRALDGLVRRRDAARESAVGELDGYDGLTTRGHPESLALSEWLLADEAPEEFLRRAAEAELLHLRPHTPAPRARGRVVVLADTGVDQLGAARLAQLAALVVLARRAGEHGAPLVVGLLGTDAWLEGDLSAVLTPWLRSRGQRRTYAADDVVERERTLDDEDEVWLLTGHRLAAELPAHATGRRRVLRVAEAAWSATGASEVRLDLDGEGLTLPVPPGPVAVRALRGVALLRPGLSPARRDPTSQVEDATLRGPVFHGGTQRLLARGGTDDVVVVGAIDWVDPVRLRRHRFPGRVLAAAGLGRRLVVVLVDDDAITVRVVGRALAAVDRIRVPLEAGPEPELLDRALDGPLAPLHFRTSYRDGELLVDLLGAWHVLSGTTCTPAPEIAAVAPGPSTDQPRVVRRERPAGTLRLDWAPLPDADPAAPVVLGPQGWLAVRSAPTTWQTYVHRGGPVIPDYPLTVAEGDHVLGLVATGAGGRRLLVRSPGGVLLRLVGHGETTTLTDLSDGTAPPALHPERPWLAVQRDPTTLEVADLTSGERVRIRGEQ